MNLSPIEWFQAQGLLLKLVQVLTPFTDQDCPSFYILDKRFFFKPPEEAPKWDRPVEVLSDLLKEVGEWAGEERGADRCETPVAQQAKRLLKEVQKVIGKLSSSDYLKEPQEEPLREALTLIKPQLEQFVEAVQETEDPTPQIVPFSPALKRDIEKKKKKPKKKNPFEEEDPLT